MSRGWAALLLLSIVSALASGCNVQRRYRYLIPQGYTGWLCVSFGVPHAPALPVEDGYEIVSFPPSGIVETSTALRPGVGYGDEHLFYDGDGNRNVVTSGQLGGGFTESSGSARKVEFWVSPDVRRDQNRYVGRGVPVQCGPFAK